MMLRFGVKLPHSGPLATPAAIRTIALEAEALGFDSVWVHDHISYGPNWSGHRASGLDEQIPSGYEPPLYEALTTLAYVASVTERVRIGTSVLVMPLRNPLVLGRQLITLQALSSNRVVLGVAVGDYPDEFQALRIDYGERGKITNEYLAVLHKIFRGGVVSHRGEYVVCAEAHFYPIVRAPQVFVGGGIIADPTGDVLAPAVLRRVAMLADGWMPDWATPELIQRGIRRIQDLRRMGSARAAPVDVAWATKLYLSDTDDDARQRTARTLQRAESVANQIAKFGFRSAGLAYERYLIGSPETIASRIGRYQDAGVGSIVMNCLAPDVQSFVGMLRRFAADVAPIFKQGHIPTV